MRATVSPYSAGLRCRCPRCGKGRLFTGFISVRARCDACDLDYGFADAGDGPAVFVVFIAGALIAGLAVLVELIWRPPYWLHALIWLPVVLAVTLGLLRPAKGLMIALQYHHDAEEGRLDRGPR